jgi:hypothetical protein
VNGAWLWVPGERLYKNNLQVWLDKINLTPWSRKPLAFSKLLFEGDPNEITEDLTRGSPMF